MGKIRRAIIDRCCPTAMFYDLPKEPAKLLLDDHLGMIIKRADIYGSEELDQYVVSPYPSSHYINVDKVSNLI